MCSTRKRDYAFELLVRQNTTASQYGLRELGPLQAYVLLALILNLVFRTPFKLFGHAILRPSSLRGNLLGWLHVGPSMFQYRPGDTRHLVCQRHDRQHGRLSAEDASQPRARLYLAGSDPRHDRAGSHDQKAP